MTKAIQLDPNAPNVAPIYGLRGLAYKDKGDKDKDKRNYDFAIVDLTKMIEIFPNALGYRIRGTA